MLCACRLFGLTLQKVPTPLLISYTMKAGLLEVDQADPVTLKQWPTYVTSITLCTPYEHQSALYKDTIKKIEY